MQRQAYTSRLSAAASGTRIHRAMVVFPTPRCSSSGSGNVPTLPLLRAAASDPTHDRRCSPPPDVQASGLRSRNPPLNLTWQCSPAPVRKRWYEVTQPTRRLVFPTQSRKQLGGYATQPNLPWQCSPAPVRKRWERGYAAHQGDGVPSAPASGVGGYATHPSYVSGKLTLMVSPPAVFPLP